ncbi:MAG: FG-GAP-like repeat-containing protein, partial [Pirellulales bacterium]|nr:FG-GAP-like repeat-containing protein [Pirellulales bacterium]
VFQQLFKHPLTDNGLKQFLADWEAQNLHQPNNPKTVADMKAALDATVLKRGVYNLVFHPHGWIRNDQMVQFIDYAQKKYGTRVKFLTFRECTDRINRFMLLGQPLRDPVTGGDNGIRIVDFDGDGYQDVMIGNENARLARRWNPELDRWEKVDSQVQFTAAAEDGRRDLGVKFGRLPGGNAVSLLVNHESDQAIYRFSEQRFQRGALPVELEDVRTSRDGVDQGVRLRDLNHDGVAEILVANPSEKKVLRYRDGVWETAQPAFPYAIVDQQGRDRGARFVDLDGDSFDDFIISNGRQTAVHLYDRETGGFTRVVQGLADIPLIVRNGTNNGVWFAEEHMWVQNEDTNRLPDGVDRRSFVQLLGNTEPGPRDPDLSLKSIQVRPGFTVELVAAEPLVMDPIALDWGADGKLWVAEMADYPLGLDDQGKPGGRVRFLEDTDGDGRYDKSTLFLDGIPYPTGVIAWRDGVIISAAPTVFFAADRNQDGKADVREDLYQGFNQGNQQHLVNGFERGLDHWLYLANGDSGGKVRSLRTGAEFDIAGLDLRIRPEQGLLDVQSGRTQFGRHRDDHGNWFGCSNPLPVRHYVLADHYLRRNRWVKFPS